MIDQSKSVTSGQSKSVISVQSNGMNDNKLKSTKS